MLCSVRDQDLIDARRQPLLRVSIRDRLPQTWCAERVMKALAHQRVIFVLRQHEPIRVEFCERQRRAEAEVDHIIRAAIDEEAEHGVRVERAGLRRTARGGDLPRTASYPGSAAVAALQPARF